MKLVIDGRPVEVRSPTTVLDAALEAGIAIPHLCDHARLQPFGACRLCLVEIKGRRGFPPSCCTPVEEGMDILTQTPELQKIRLEILEMILSEHPFACLICSEKDQCQDKKSTIRKVAETTGCILCPNDKRCELQKVVADMGLDKVRYPALYRNFDVRKDDPFFDRDYNLCILCGRCVRVCREVRGASAIDFVSRGSLTVIGTALDRPLAQSGCQFCGACVDVCPTGALSERASRPDERPDGQADTVCALCSNGCRLSLALKGGRLISVEPSESGPANRGQACVKGRFLAREIVSGERRILQPHVRKGEELVEATWEEAFATAAKKLAGLSGSETALITSPQASLEDLFAAYKFGREVLRTDNISGAAGLSGFSAFSDFLAETGVSSGLNMTLEEIGRADVIVVCGENLPVSQPLIWLEVLKSVRGGAKLIVLDTEETKASLHAALSIRIDPGDWASALIRLAAEILPAKKKARLSRVDGFNKFQDSLKRVPRFSDEKTGLKTDGIREAARLLGSSSKAMFFLGPELALGDGTEGALEALWNISVLTGGRLWPSVQENNLRGELELRRALAVKAADFGDLLDSVRQGGIKALYLTGPAPRLDRSRLEVLIVQDPYWSPNAQQADVVFPAATFLAAEGTFVSMEGRVQRFGRAVAPAGESKPDWEILAGLARAMGSDALNYENSGQVLKHVESAGGAFSGVSGQEAVTGSLFIKEGLKGKSRKFLPLPARAFHRAIDTHYPFSLILTYGLDYYRSFILSRDVKGLRKLRDSSWVAIDPEDADSLGLKDGDKVVLESQQGTVVGLVRVSKTVGRGNVRAWFLVPGEMGLEWWGRGPTPVKVGKG